MPVTIITDSAASIPAHLIDERDVTVVPMRISVGDESYDDGEIDQQEIVDCVERGVRVTTSAPSPGAWAEAIGSRAGPDGVAVLTIAASMSATYDAAKVAAGLHDHPVEVVDTQTAAGAQAIVVLEAARVAATGAALEQVVAHARSVADKVRLVATVGGLDYLVRSGRVPGIAGRAGDALGAKPVFEFRHGKPRPLMPSFGRNNSLDKVVERWQRTAGDGGRLHVAALHAMAESDARTMLDRVEEQVDPAISFVAEFSTVMVAHTGPGLAGLAWWWEGR